MMSSTRLVGSRIFQKARQTALLASAIHLTLLLAASSIAQAPLKAPSGSQLAEQIHRALVSGESSVTTPGVTFTAALPQTLAEVLQDSRVVLVKVKAKATVIDSHGVGLMTWDRLALLETLYTPSKTATSSNRLLKEAPSSLGVAGQEDIILSHIGGKAVVDGVTVRTPFPHEDLKTGKTYLLFLATGVGDGPEFLRFGSNAIYEVVDDSLIAANSSSSNLISSDLKAQFNNRLSLLKAYLHGK